ncbi:hypothetical protein ACQ4LE_002877 [Meloidogyne hapla]
MGNFISFELISINLSLPISRSEPNHNFLPYFLFVLTLAILILCSSNDKIGPARPRIKPPTPDPPILAVENATVLVKQPTEAKQAIAKIVFCIYWPSNLIPCTYTAKWLHPKSATERNRTTCSSNQENASCTAPACVNPKMETRWSASPVELYQIFKEFQALLIDKIECCVFILALPPVSRLSRNLFIF